MHKQKLSAELLIFAITFGLIANAFVLGVVHAQITIPVQGADVSATGSNGFGSTVSDSQGHYVITTFLDSGTYSVTASAQGYVRTTVNNVAVTAGAETSNVNILMPVSGAISGKVTDASSGSPIQYAYVTAYNASGTSQSGSTALTDANGNYQIITNLDTGTYNVTVQYTTNHLSNTVSGVSVTAGSTTANVNFALAASGIIAGTVTDSASLAPLSSIIIEAIDVNGNAACVGHTDSTGNYSLNNSLPTGTYNVTALLPAGHLLKTVAGVAITAGSTTTVNLALTPSGIISGKVTSSSGQPVSGAFITASFGGFVDYATSDSNGNYRITDGLPTGSYTVTASSGLTFNQVTGVSVVQGAETSNVNIVLAIPLSGTITGRVTNSTGRPIQYATVDAQSLTSSGSASTDANGNYAITGLATDSYNVTASATGFVSASEDSIPVTVNTVTADVNFQLAAIASGIISGTVTSELVDTAPPRHYGRDSDSICRQCFTSRHSTSQCHRN